MWALPDIKSLNARAASNADKLRREAQRKRKPICEHWDCNGRADESFLWYDIFSDDPKGVIHLCERHVGYSGDPMEGFFNCCDCGRVMIENHTWELYYRNSESGRQCLRCAAEEHFQHPDTWINPRDVKDVVLDPSSGNVIFANGILNLAKCPHVLGVKQPLPAGIEFFDNCEFDSCDGRQISGDKPFEIIRQLRGQPFCPVLDAAYQFAVSIGFYLRVSVKLNAPPRSGEHEIGS
jgi:hypothetical protein